MNIAHNARAQYRWIGVVPSTLGDSVIAVSFGHVLNAGVVPISLTGVTVLIESLPAGSKVELWLPHVIDGTLGAASFDVNTDYFYAGLVCAPAGTAYTATGETVSYGSASWPLAAWKGAQLRVKNWAGAGGAGKISASVF